VKRETSTRLLRLPAPSLTDDATDDEGQVDPFAAMIDHIVGETAKDRSYPFQPDVTKLIAQIKRKDRAAFERLRERLKAGGFLRWTELEKLVDAEMRKIEEAEARDQKDADAILKTVRAEVELFHAPDKRAYADVRHKDRRETWDLRGKGFKRWMRYQHRQIIGPESSLSDSALSQVIQDLESDAFYEGDEREVFVRVGEHDGKIYIDLGDESWSAIEIDESGWRIDKEPPTRFRRTAGMLQLPMPERGGEITDLLPFINVKRRDDRALIIAYAQAALRPQKGYPVLVVTGEHNAAKSTLLKVLKSLLDPGTPPLRGLPRDERDLVIRANNGHLLGFDNVSALPDWLSDAICRLATGGGFGTRQLFSDADEALFDATRPIMLNGIEDVVSRADLMDRSIYFALDPIPESERRTEVDFWQDFDRQRPSIFGAFLGSMSDGLRRLPSVRLRHKPRMLDFARWGRACEPYDPPTFDDAYDRNRRSVLSVVLEQDVVAATVSAWVPTWRDKAKLAAKDIANGVSETDDQRQWEGHASLLHDLLEKSIEPALLTKHIRSKRWPTTAHGLSGCAATTIRL
jgi:hypothetical protein